MSKRYIKQLAQFGLKVKSLRIKNKLTQVQLAGLMDVDVKTIKRIEKGDYNPTLVIIFALSEALETETKSLL